ncbi:MAG: serine hydrolase [Actinobacteria bacterium]|nr:MAG: serine hydrolase [Actinomycetota bacterium]
MDANRNLSLTANEDGTVIVTNRHGTQVTIDLHGGRVLMESYFNGMAARTRHLLMSVSKSVTSVVCGRLVDRGLLSPNDPVTTHLPELAGTSWDGCTVRHLLDMRAGTRFDEDYTNLDADVRVYEQIYLWRPRANLDLPVDITAYYARLGNECPHGGRFDYRSILTDLLAWVMERAAGARFGDLVANELWGPMGAEDDAEVTVDGHGNAMADGGICCTLRDLARFGLLILRDGRGGSEQVIPREWIQDALTADPETVAAFAAAPDAVEFPAGAYYRNQFWVVDPRGPILMASGINGQTVLVHGPADVVIAKFSTWPVAWTPDFGVTTRTGLIDLAERVAG